MKEAMNTPPKSFTVLIADRNMRVREFLRREFLVEGYTVKLAKNGQQILEMVYSPDPVDLLIMDLDLPDMDGTEILSTLQYSIPVILHTYSKENSGRSIFPMAAAFVEKRGNSIEGLKKIVREIFVRQRFGKTY
mgnify:CR=1 FL=1